MPENTPAVSEPAPTVNTSPTPTAPVIAPVMAIDPQPVKKSNTLLWIVVLAVLTILTLGGAYLYTQGYFGTTSETLTSSDTGSAEAASAQAELDSIEPELTSLENDLAQFETEGSTF